jgi:hypothetical protein
MRQKTKSAKVQLRRFAAPFDSIAQICLRLVIRVAKSTGFFGFLGRISKRYRNVVSGRMYNAWAVDNEKECFEQDTSLSFEPMISIVVPTYNTVEHHLLTMVYSIINQHYENWELLLVNASNTPISKEMVRKCATIDTRIKIIEVKRNRGIAGNTNAGIEEVSGDYIAFLDHDDVLHPCALHSVVSKIVNNNAGLIYTDEDKTNHEGNFFFGPHCKPKWSPNLFHNVNYINHFTVVKTKFVQEVKGLRVDCDGAQDFDLLLRIIDACQPVIVHIPRILYHWRAAESSTASDFTNKRYVLTAGVRALQEHIDRNGQKATAEAIPQRPGFYKVIHKSNPTISIVIGPVARRWQRACAAWLSELLKEMSHQDIELIIGSWYSAYLGTQTKIKIRTVGDKNYWSKASELVSNKVVICFQSAAFPAEPADLLQLAAVAAQSSCATASPMIVSKGGGVVDAGLVETDFGLSPLFKGCKLNESTPFGSVEWVRDVDAPSLMVFATRAENFTEITSGKDVLPLRPALARKLKGDHIVWSHSLFKHKGSLDYSSDSGYFNSQLSLEHSTINMRTSSWEVQNDRSENE